MGRIAVQCNEGRTFIVSSIFNLMSLGVLASAGFNPAGLEPLYPVFLLASSVSCFALGESIIVFGALLSFQKSCDPFDMQSEKEKIL